MRILEHIPHAHFKVTLFEWNEKYLLKLETPSMEMVYKIPKTFGDAEKVKGLLTPEFYAGNTEALMKMRDTIQAELKKG